jgi:hypothetical protein
LPTAVIGELIELFIGFVSAFALQDFEVFEGGRVDGTKAVGAIDIGCRFDEPLSGQHQIRQKITKSFESTRSYHAIIVP